MPEEKNNKEAMSRALGAAFLNHQVQQLEKTVETGFASNPRMNNAFAPGGPKGPRRGEAPGRGRNHGDRGVAGGKRGRYAVGNGGARSGNGVRGGVDGEHARDLERNSDLDEKEKDGGKDADIVVVDASVLVHAIGELKKWCRPKREEIVIIPLEALNTLDLLKKGTSAHAQRARAASRILEQQVGTNQRIRVQSDDAYLLWGDIPFSDEPVDEKDKLLDPKSSQTAPEWLRCIISCARWEVDRVIKEHPNGDEEEANKGKPTVALAVCLSSTFPDQVVLHEGDTLSSSPVPLPVPILQQQKYEQRASGSLVHQWANKAGIQVLDFPATPLPKHMTGANNAVAGHIDIPRIANGGGTGGRTRAGVRHGHSRGSSDEIAIRGPSPITNGTINISRARSGSSAGANGAGRPNPKGMNINTKMYGMTLSGAGERMVERPAATMAMNASSILQPTRVVRVLARGEKLEP